MVLNDPSRFSESQVRANIERQQRQALLVLQRRLRAFYRGAGDEFQVGQQREIEATTREELSRAQDRIRAEFERYAQERAPLLARLSILVGFPDPNPYSKPPDSPLRPVARQRFEEAAQVRGELEALDKRFEANSEAILASVTNLRSDLESALRLRIQAFRDQLNERAEREALSQVRLTARDLGLQLLDTPPIVLPPSGTRTATVPGEPPLPAAPKVPSLGIGSGLADRRRLAEQELRIWLGLNRYRLAPGAPDATGAFQQWRTKYRAGR